MSRWLTVLVLAACALLGSNASADEVLDKAKSLIDGNQSQAAYDLLKPLEEDRAGDPNFDYLLGLSALNSEKPLDALFALERAVDAAPNSGPARAELARAYLALGDTVDAEREFEEVQKLDLPSDVQRTVDRYLSSLDQYHDRSQLRYRPYVSMGFGYDSNVNSATTDNQIAIPAFGGLIFTLTGDSLETESAIWDMAAGARITAPINRDKGLSFFANVDLNHHLAIEASNFTTFIASGRTGVNWRTNERNQFTLSADGNTVRVEGSSGSRSDREAIGSTAQWQYTPNEANQFTVFGQFSLVRYPEQRVRDVNRYIGGVGWGHAFVDYSRTPVIFASFFGGYEDEKSESAGSHFSRDIYGVRIGGQITAHERGTVFGSFTYQASDYNAPDPTFLETRDDDYINVEFGYRFDFDDNWSLSPLINYNNNDSNIITNDYDRFAVMFTVRNDF